MRQSNDLEWFSSQFQMNVINNKSNFAVNQHKTKCGTTKTYNLERSNSLLGASDFRDFVLRVFFSRLQSPFLEIWCSNVAHLLVPIIGQKPRRINQIGFWLVIIFLKLSSRLNSHQRMKIWRQKNHTAKDKLFFWDAHINCYQPFKLFKICYLGKR